MLSLAATFENSEGKTHRWRMKDPDPNKPNEVIKATLEKLTTLNLFEKDGVKLFQKVTGAKFIEKIATPVFNKEQEETVSEPIKEEVPVVEPIVEPIVEPVVEVVKNSAELPRDLQKLIVDQEMIEPELMRLVFKLPEGVKEGDMNQMEAVSLMMALKPQNSTIVDLDQDEKHPDRFILTIRIDEPDPEAMQSPPAKGKRRRLLGWLKK